MNNGVFGQRFGQIVKDPNKKYRRKMRPYKRKGKRATPSFFEKISAAIDTEPTKVETLDEETPEL